MKVDELKEAASRASDDLRALRAQVARIAPQGRILAEQLERGQAQSPLAEHFDRLGRDLNAAPFTVTLFGLTVEGRGEVLGALFGREFGLLSVRIPAAVGLVEVALQERGFVLEKVGGERLEFDRVEPFLSALQSADLIRAGDAGSWVDPLRLGMTAPPGLQGLVLAMPENTSAVVNSPALLSRVRATSNLLMLAAPSNHLLTDEDREALTELCDAVQGVWPLVLPSAGKDVGATPWWEDRGLFGEAFALMPLKLEGDAAQRLSGLLTGGGGRLREAFFLAHQLRRLRAAVDAVADRQEQEQRQVASRRSTIDRRIGALERGARERDPKTELEPIRALMEDELTQLRNALVERSKKLLLPGGELTERIREIVGRLTARDLVKEVAPTTIRLRVDDAFIAGVVRRLGESMWAALGKDLALLRDGLESLRTSLEERVAEFRGAPVNVELPFPDERPIHDAIEEMLGVEIRYRGELPKRGFLQRLGEGRRMVFMILMSASLFGGIGLRSMPGVSVIMIGLFLGGVLMTYRTWNREEEAQLEREIGRVQDALGMEVRRLAENAEREKLARISDHLGRVRKELQRQMELVSRETAQSRQTEGQSERDDLRGRLRHLDGRARELQAFAQQIGRLGGACSEAEGACRRALGEVVRSLPGEST